MHTENERSSNNWLFSRISSRRSRMLAIAQCRRHHFNQKLSYSKDRDRGHPGLLLKTCPYQKGIWLLCSWTLLNIHKRGFIDLLLIKWENKDGNLLVTVLEKATGDLVSKWLASMSSAAAQAAPPMNNHWWPWVFLKSVYLTDKMINRKKTLTTKKIILIKLIEFSIYMTLSQMTMNSTTISTMINSFYAGSSRKFRPTPVLLPPSSS